jgi:hypothetical protein
MTWKEAKQQTVAQWRLLIDRIGHDDVLDLLIELNAVTALCERARVEALEHGEPRKCQYCLAYDQLGGCGAVEEVLSEKLVAGEWDEARDLARRILADLESLEVPAPELSGV